MTSNEDKPISTGEHQKRVARFLVESIARSGIDGVHFGKRSLEFGKNNANQIVGKYAGSDDPEAPRKIAEELTELMFEKSQDIIKDEADDTGALAESGEWEVVEGGSE
jgi:hypothetical protein